MTDQPRFACIVGAPRCGTTSLAGYLKEHPDVCFSSVKEPHFFAQHDLRGLGEEELGRLVEQNYVERYFAARQPSHRLLAEGSVTYLYAAEQMEPILRLWPDARFIIAVRDPLQMLPSLHQRLLYLGDETVTDFEQAWQLRHRRARGEAIPRSCVEPRFLQYEEGALLGKHVERFFAAVGRERCQVVLFDDLKADPAGVYRRLLDFLGLPDDGRRDFTAWRASRGYRSAVLQRLLKRPPVVTRAVLAGEKYRLRVGAGGRPKQDPPLVRALLAGRKKLLRWNNSAPPPPVHLPERLKAEIRDRLADDVGHLSRLIGRDLGHWLALAPEWPAVPS